MINTNTHTGPSFSLQNRLARLLWNTVYWLFFRFSPRTLHAWRAFLLRLFGAKLGRGVHVYPGVVIWAPWNLELGDQAGVASGVNLYNQGKISIGKKAVISQGAHLCASSHDYTQKGFPLITKPILVGEEAWIAADAFIGPGVCIGEGAIVGARSAVFKNVDPWTVVGGNPAQFIKKIAPYQD